MYTPKKSIIDNDKIKLFIELKNILNDQSNAFDVAAGYFNVSGFELVAQEIKGVKKFRLLLGHSPVVDDKVKPDIFDPKSYKWQFLRRVNQFCQYDQRAVSCGLGSSANRN